MRTRNWTATLSVHSESLAGGMSCSKEQVLAKNLRFAPTVEAVRKAVSQLAPDFTIDEADMTVKEQIEDSLYAGFFSLFVVPVGGSASEFDVYSLGFVEE